MSQWTFTIEHYDQTVYAHVTTASDASLTFPLSNPAEVSLTVKHNSQEMNAIYTLLQSTMPVLRASRDGVGVFLGPMTSCESSLDDDGTTSLTFTDYMGSLADCIRSDFDKGTTISTEAVLATIVSGSQGVYMLGSPTGYANQLVWNNTYSGTVAAQTVGNFGLTQSVLDQIRELADQDYNNGFEWYADVDPSTGKCRVFTGFTIGDDKSSSLVFAYGENTQANCSAAQITYLPPVNLVQTNDNDDGRTSQVKNTSSITKYGEHGIFGDPQPWVTTADSRGKGLLRPNPRNSVEITTIASLAPAPWTDYWLGDTVRVQVKRDNLSIDSNLRVNQVSIALNDAMIDTNHQISFEQL